MARSSVLLQCQSRIVSYRLWEPNNQALHAEPSLCQSQLALASRLRHLVIRRKALHKHYPMLSEVCTHAYNMRLACVAPVGHAPDHELYFEGSLTANAFCPSSKAVKKTQPPRLIHRTRACQPCHATRCRSCLRAQWISSYCSQLHDDMQLYNSVIVRHGILVVLPWLFAAVRCQFCSLY